MSVSSRAEESVYWNPSISEIAELLQNLGLSPPRSFDDNLLVTPELSWRNSAEFGDHEETKIRDYVFESEKTINENLRREAIIEELQIAREDGRFIKWRNNYFHDYLVEHFRRKQMMHVCTNESEDDILLNEYLRRLDELERSSEELRGSREEWDAEIARTRDDIRGKKEKASVAVNEMIGEERAIGKSTWYCGKPLSIRRVQTLIARQLDRIKDIAKFRIRYTRLRDELIAIEGELRRCAISRPNLTKEDYERLEAEKFRYRLELTIIDKQCDEYYQRHDELVILMDTTSRRIAKAKRNIDNCKRTIESLRNNVRKQLRERKICLARLVDGKHFIREFNEIIGQTMRPEFATRMSSIRMEHDEWMKRISLFLCEIEKLERTLNSLGSNLMLR